MLYNIALLSFCEHGFTFEDKWIKFSACENDKANLKPIYHFHSLKFDDFNGIEISETYNIKKGRLIRKNHQIVMASDDWTHFYVPLPFSALDLDFFLIQAFYTHAVKRHMIQVHSSLIDYQGRGIMFLGPSGIGKTTQAERWNEYRGAVIINGDMVFVQETEDQFLGWGTPWHGSSPYCENASVPLEALVILKQSPVNRIRRLEGFEMVAEVSNSVFYPTWLENGMDLCLETLDHLLTHVPVYLLENRADEEAVTLLEQTLDQNKKE